MQMVNWGLILVVVGVLTISEARANECKHESEEFCHLINAAHGKNQDNLKDMDGDLNGNGMKALALADKFVVAVLNAEEQQLLPALKKALKAELSALVQVKADCFKLFKSYNEKCEKIYSNIGYAIAELIQAIIGSSALPFVLSNTFLTFQATQVFESAAHDQLATSLSSSPANHYGSNG
ncbi:hypothetical protein Q1695_004382 [Nippostrongylus brasiliensis]|nr:hypothetical protein Q1695_004382 [Nippostrongylus brasiliensis]